MDDVFNAFFGGLPTWNERPVWPAVDVSEDDNAITVKAEVPGCKSDDIDVSVQGNTLTISGEKKHEEEKKEKGYYHFERASGSFRRDITLPADVDPSKVDASCKDGVLTLVLPKEAKARAVKVKIKSQ
jgi:HSP20 family protein